jgi:RNA polymerase primary sigma factor
MEQITRFETSDNMPLYMKTVQKYRVLTKEEELELGKRIQQGDTEAIDMLVCANLRYVVQQANKFIGQGVAIDDLIEEGNEALIEAAKRFDPKQNKKFITFAHFYLQKAFNLANGNYGKIVRLPQNQEYDIYKRRMAGEDINLRTIELDRPIGEDGDNTMGDILLKSNPDVDIEREHDKYHVTVLMSKLDEVSSAIITKRFGLDGGCEMTIEEIAENMSMKSADVRKAYNSALKQMKPATAK